MKAVAHKPPNGERRKHPRTAFAVADRPIFKVGPQEFAVVDISASGLRFQNEERINLGGWVSGVIVFAGCDPIRIDGIVVRNQAGALGLHFATPLLQPFGFPLQP
jgi:hypothetical protein